MEKLELFLVAKRDRKKVFLAKRMAKKQFCVDQILQKFTDLPSGWDLKTGDIIGCILAGTIARDGWNLQLWIPVKTYPSVRNLILSDLVEDGYVLSETKELVSADRESARALPGEEWRCVGNEIHNNKVVYYPCVRISRLSVDIQKSKGNVFYVIKRVSGKKIVSTEVKVAAEKDTIRLPGIVRERYLFTIHKLEDLSKVRADVFSINEPVELSGYMVIDRSEDMEKVKIEAVEQPI